MVAATNGRKRRYNAEEIKDIAKHEDITGIDGMTFLCALNMQPMIVEYPSPGMATLANLRTISIPVIETEDYLTGIYSEAGHMPIIVINADRSIMDYDLISDLHPVKDSEIYLWLSHPWEELEEEDLGIYGEWYRRIVYKDGMRPYDGTTRGWEDQPPTSYEETE